MMLETKIQIEALKLIGTPKEAFLRCAEGDMAVYMTLDGYCAFRIPETQFMLDISKIRRMDALRTFFEGVGDKGENLKFRHSISDGKGTKTVLVCDEFETWINADFYKKLCVKGCKMYAESEKSKVYFTLGDMIYAVCMPLEKK